MAYTIDPIMWGHCVIGEEIERVRGSWHAGEVAQVRFDFDRSRRKAFRSREVWDGSGHVSALKKGRTNTNK